ncbi:MAG: hypothetical protein ABGY24_13105, partial [bacterium]
MILSLLSSLFSLLPSPGGELASELASSEWRGGEVARWQGGERGSGRAAVGRRQSRFERVSEGRFSALARSLATR